ncbi:hypothetical protein G3I59_24700 [Amycolatopsis rubida]|uniref:Prenyltransferase alpha-alpha toroid domain-containing protein n=1 Tax=Amycolatopsis rubida TaxID=112413 RepID=A0ABX0BSW5_9PSEU|nr:MULTISPECIES: prenyltransferase/squalene oxidase repeat-containing protein [Amycolatopsis]MYW93727.1 hypothetical protein [Amycolatopsis rubida]NEC58714.1 hypothetical protein [Amycolatopsis rubida]OAP22907.1 hypothetical protein A4R44_06369 [Amycolatopsis sp. M39]
MTEPASFVGRCRDSAGLLVETDEDRPSLEATRFGAEVLALTGSGPEAADLGFVAGARRGPAYAMHRGGELSLGATYYALRLHELAGIAVPAPAETGAWVASSLVRDGSVGVDMDDLFYGIRSLLILALRLDRPAEDAVREFLGRCTADGGGCALEPGHSADIERTYCAVAILQWLGADDDQLAAQRHAGFATACDDGRGHIKMRPAEPAWSLASAYWGARTVQLLGLPWRWEALGSAVRECARPDGGYSAHDESTLWETYCALRVRRITAVRQGKPT